MLYGYYVENDFLKEAACFEPAKGEEIYEVIRVTEGVPLFLEDHLDRFYRSARLCGMDAAPGPDSIREGLEKLMTANMMGEGNIRFSHTSYGNGLFRAFFIPHAYPGENMRKEGVSCGLLTAERQDPNAKVYRQELRTEADRLREEKGHYEVLLVDRRGCITEGSRSNVFFLRNGCFYTAPDPDVLPGITRKKVLEIIFQLNYIVITDSVRKEELPAMEGVFLTGTSPKVLPVHTVGSFRFRVGHPMVSRVADAYDELIRTYIGSRLS